MNHIDTRVFSLHQYSVMMHDYAREFEMPILGKRRILIRMFKNGFVFLKTINFFENMF